MKRTRRLQPGFTIVELLIVIVVIAILAAISIVAYNGIQDRARNAAAQSAAIQAKKKLEIYKLGDGNGNYPNTGNLAQAGLSESDGYQYTSNGTTYCVTATNGTKSYKTTETTDPVQGGCPGHGQGGVPAITNLVTNPSFASNVVGWGSSGASISRVTSPWSADGNGAIQVTATGQDSYAYVNIPAQAGVTYTFIATVRIESAQTGSFQGSTQQRNMFPAFTNSSGTYLSTGGGVSSVPANTPGTYQQRSTGVAPANTASIILRLYNGATSGSVYWDQVMVVEGTYNGSYADGASQNWTWNGTPNASTSTGPTP